MNGTNKTKVNFILIPKWFCHRMKWHEWLWKSRNRALVSATCVRCGMNGAEYHRLLKEESRKAIEREGKR